MILPYEVENIIQKIVLILNAVEGRTFMNRTAASIFTQIFTESFKNIRILQLKHAAYATDLG